MRYDFSMTTGRLALCAVSIAAVVSSGCSTSQNGAQSSQPKQASSSAHTASMPTSILSVKPWKKGDPVPNFTGSWRDRLVIAYKVTTTDNQRQVLADGKITEQEYSQLQDAFGQCLAPHGFTNFSYDMDGTMEYRPPQRIAEDDLSRIHVDCQNRTAGPVELIFTGMKTNPQNEDITELMAACFVRSGLTPKGYSGADYHRDSPNNYPFDKNDSRYRDCSNDPKGILGK